MNENTLPFKKSKNEKDLSAREMYNRLDYERKRNDNALRDKQKNADHNFKQQIRNYIFKFAAIATPILMLLWIISVCFNLTDMRLAIEALGTDVLLLIFGALLGKIL